MAVDRDERQTGTESADTLTATPQSRGAEAHGTLALEWLEERSDGAQAWIAVTLAYGGRVVTGQSPPVRIKRRRHGVHRAVLATLNAVEHLARQRVSCELLDVGRTRAGDRTWIRVRLRVSVRGKAAEVRGSARVRDGAADAAARAVVDALSESVDLILSQAE
jgi:hypothetical protein